MKRVFIAVKSSKKIQSLASEWNKDKKEWSVRWIPEENLHITLTPPWTEDNIDEIASKLGQIQERVNPFDLKLKRIVYGPRPSQFRLIWAEGAPAPELKKLKKIIEKSLGVNSAKREFIPHLTLARFRPENFLKLPNRTLNKEINWIENIKSFELIESILSPAGARYKVLKSFKL